MGDLSERVDAGIRAAGPVDVDIAVEDNARGLSQLSHDGSSVFLLLPAAVSRAIVFKKNFESDQGFEANRKYSETRQSG
jgi:hypothetical protein